MDWTRQEQQGEGRSTNPVRDGMKQRRPSLEIFGRPSKPPLNSASLRASLHISILISVHPKSHLFPKPSLTLHSPHPFSLCPAPNLPCYNVLRALYMFTHLILTLLHFTDGKNEAPKRASKLPKVTQGVNSGAGIQTQGLCLKSMSQ